MVTAGPLRLGDLRGIPSQAAGRGDGGSVIVNAGTLTIRTDGLISTDTFGAGRGGNIGVTIAGALSIDGTLATVPTGITAVTAFGTGDAGNISVNAGTITLVTDGLISADTLRATGTAGTVTHHAAAT